MNSTRLNKPSSPAAAAAAWAKDFRIHAKDPVCFFLRSHKDAPSSTKHSDVFAFIVTGAAPQDVRLAIRSFHPTRPVIPTITENTAAVAEKMLSRVTIRGAERSLMRRTLLLP